MHEYEGNGLMQPNISIRISRHTFDPRFEPSHRGNITLEVSNIHSEEGSPSPFCLHGLPERSLGLAFLSSLDKKVRPHIKYQQQASFYRVLIVSSITSSIISYIVVCESFRLYVNQGNWQGGGEFGAMNTDNNVRALVQEPAFATFQEIEIVGTL